MSGVQYSPGPRQRHKAFQSESGCSDQPCAGLRHGTLRGRPIWPSYLLIDYGEDAAEQRWKTATELIESVVKFWNRFLRGFNRLEIQRHVGLPVGASGKAGPGSIHLLRCASQAHRAMLRFVSALRVTIPRAKYGTPRRGQSVPRPA